MSNELTDVRCPCGAEFQADSYDAGFIAGSGMCQNCDAAMPPKDIPAPVEQAGGDERAAFELFVRKHCGMPEHIAVNWDAKFTNDAWEAWQARAALAQPSPKCATCNGTGQIVVSGPHYCGELQPPEYETEPCDMCSQPSPAQGGDQ
ncbi:hypothetical protein [Pseudomonas aeruginosa]|uniref:hypothetical protein n=1 Tax=Pseudomonas aeruginosa TaxID=287 RepID=UPI0003B9CC6D|nr:hypothetical protein [Pseudomonas aeruginosa]ERW65346.1 hypothetical protein Q026_03422 [Pseudomonas aeruginosa BWHPSA013]HCF0216093.1 hypothetical protein [Pseudomonas aeruginosa]HCF4466099.1 hypothetical protein [Pseudomonas aeruginosa]